MHVRTHHGTLPLLDACHAGAGKTFTMSGDASCYERRGLIPRVLAALLSSLRSAPGLASWSLALSYLEVYNDALYDLLDINASPSELTLYEDAAGQLQVRAAVIGPCDMPWKPVACCAAQRMCRGCRRHNKTAGCVPPEACCVQAAAAAEVWC